MGSVRSYSAPLILPDMLSEVAHASDRAYGTLVGSTTAGATG
jgi:hypothetical protein